MRSKIILIFFLFTIIMWAEDSEEKIFSFEDETYHSTELSDLLQKLKRKPINVNRANEKELSQIPWLSEMDIQKIIRHHPVLSE